MKLIELKLTQEDSSGVTAISLVDYPAIEENFIKFKKESSMKFALDEEKQIIAGPCMIPDKHILRIDEGEEYFVFFKEDTIRQLSEKFFLDGNINSATLQHEDTLNGVTVVESWIIEDSKKDKSAVYGFELPVGSWFVLMKVHNLDVWERIKSGELKGFSIEGIFANELIKSENMDAEKLSNSIIEKISKFFEPKKEEEKFGTVGVVNSEGAEMVISFDGDVLEVGSAINYEIDGEMKPVPSGEYTTEGGEVLVVAEDGVLGEIKEAVVEEELTKEGIMNEVGKLIEQLLEPFAEKMGEEMVKSVDTKIDEVNKSIEEMKQEFMKPADKKTKTLPKDDPKPDKFKSLNQKIRERKEK